jgi:phosphonate transport system substrate-binding protein
MLRLATGRARLAAFTLVLAAALGASAASAARQHAAASKPTLTVSAIPDQDPQVLQRLYGTVTAYLSKKLGVPVAYRPMTDYTAAVTGFKVGDLQLVWFGGLTGVQARAQVPGAVLLAQRDIDDHFHSVFVANANSGLAPVKAVAGLAELKGHTFTFGSNSSTSGFLMPAYFLDKAGLDMSSFRGQPGYSGSHDATLALVSAGSYDAGALNEQVWLTRLADKKVDTTKVRVIFRTPAFHDYHWVARPGLDEVYGAGFTKKLKAVLVGIKGHTAAQRTILSMFGAASFIPTKASNYTEIEQIGRKLGLVR